MREGDHPADQPGQSANITCKTWLQNRQGGSGWALERAKGIEPSYDAKSPKIRSYAVESLPPETEIILFWIVAMIGGRHVGSRPLR
jgi:hypothetical protein